MDRSRLELLHAYLKERSSDPQVQTCFVLQAPTVSRNISWSITDSAQEIHVSLYASPDLLTDLQNVLGPENSEGLQVYRNGKRHEGNP